jgi:hypothetical protein
MNGKIMLYLDQFGNRFWAHSVRELRERIGGGRVSKLYQDKRDGSAVHIGYVIGQHWLSAFVPVERPA